MTRGARQKAVEGSIFVCEWKRQRGGFSVWVMADPTLKAWAQSFEVADELLSSVITQATGDGESQHEYVPVRPTPELPDALAAMARMLTADNSATIQNPDALFAEGYCSVCSRPLGPRTEEQITVDRIGGTGDGVDAAHDGHDGRLGPMLPLVSTDFVEQLSASELARVTLRPVATLKKSKKQFVEVVDATRKVPFVVLRKSFVTIDIYECELCGGRETPFYAWPPAPQHFVSADSLPRRIPSFFVAGQFPNVSLCMSERRWESIAGKTGTKGIRTYPLGIAKPEFVEPDRT